jgi:RNA polymerase sigma-70 factor (ECF subfamily)
MTYERPPTGVAPDDTPDVALTRLVDAYGGQLFALGLRFCGGDRADAEDLVQETFLNAYRGWSSFEGRADPRTWLYTIASRVCQRMRRRRAGEPAHIGSLDELLPFGDPLIATIATDEPDVLQRQIRREATAEVEAAIAALPESFRIPLVLKEIVGFTVPEVAAMLGLDEGTVKSRVHRARLKLRSAVDTVLPRAPKPAPPPAYPRQVCLDLLQAKQEAMDRGVPFDHAVICDRCRSVFASLDLTQEVCRDLARGDLPAAVRDRIIAAVRDAAP